jgi:RNA polymerase sigma factor (sigma-70 family)
MASAPSSEPTDEALLAMHLAGDAAAFLRLVERYGPMLTRVMRRGIERPQDADELVQDTFLQLHRHASDFDPQRTLRPWLMTIGMNLKREYFRRKGRRPEALLVLDGRRDPSVPPSDGFGQRDAARTLEKAMAGLPEAQREVIELHWFAGLSMTDVAAVLGASLSAVKVRAHRGYARMRAALTEET